MLNRKICDARVEVFTPMKIQVKVFWVVMLCSIAIGYHCFGEPQCLHLHPEDGGILSQHCM